MSTPLSNADLLVMSRAVAMVPVHCQNSDEMSDLNEVDRRLLLAAGDNPARPSFFDFDECRAPLSTDHGTALLTLDRCARLHDYRDWDHKRVHRSMITVPPKVRENIVAICGAATENEVLITTLLVALADYAAMDLVRRGTRLHVLPATDDLAELRRQVRQEIANRAVKRG